jgi:hypothetical protein
MNDVQALADRYVALWNEADATRRREEIAALFASSAEHFVGSHEVRGFDALVERVRGSHEKNVRDAGRRFHAVRNAQELQDTVTFNWKMTPADDPNDVRAVGLEFLVLDESGRIAMDYQFIVKG